jgi:antitoxin CptB
MQAPAIDARTLSRLQWRCRRGMLENDLLIQRFFERHGSALDAPLVAGVQALMELSDNELLDLLLRRTEPAGELDCGDVHQALRLMRPTRSPESP